jgi:hypothetical protein
MSWRDVDRIGVSGDNDERSYSIGYLTAAAIDRYLPSGMRGEEPGATCQRILRQYVTEYGKHPEIAGRFSRATEQLLESRSSR